MRSALIGHTGFIGGNLVRQFLFTDCYHSQTISAIRGRDYDLLVCAGVTAKKWWANQNAGEDRAAIDSLLSHLAMVKSARVVVISTVDVYPVSAGVDEGFDCDAQSNHAYGMNRRYFEKAVGERFENVQIVRVGGVFGPGLKKNVIYDLLHANCLDKINRESRFQYYNVASLWRDIERLGAIRLANFVTEPLRTADVIDELFPGTAVGCDAMPVARYDVRTQHNSVFGGPVGYMASAASVMEEMRAFVADVRELEAA